MKLAEALILRADVQKRVQQLRERLVRAARVQEGEAPPEDPQALLAELRTLIDQFTELVQRVNRTNSAAELAPGVTLTDALAERDALLLERSVLGALIAAAAGTQEPMYGFRMTRSEIKVYPTVNITEMQRRADELARRYRELDTSIQALNWNVDLLD